jgi:antitoxin component YwqK of YwqJK toxin-antitoxin module
MITPCSENKPLPAYRFLPVEIHFIPVFLFLMILFVSCERTEKAYYRDGQPKFIIPKNSLGKIEGDAKWWYENGSLMLTAEYKNGQLNGKMTRYYDNGNKQTEDNYLLGKLNGLSREMDLNGNVYSEKTYMNGTLNAISRQFNGIGQVTEEGNYLNGYFDGEWKYYDRFGKLIATANFNHGSGIKKSWNSDGKIAMTTEYRDNLIHGTVRMYNTGEIVSERIVQPGEE